MPDPTPLSNRYWYLEGTEARLVDVPVPEFWDQLMTGQHRDPIVGDVARSDGWLVTQYEMADDMQSSEMHPEGDELHYIVSGALDLVLEEDGGDRTLALDAGTSAVVPKGVWHRFVVREPAVAVAMTCGRGTQHRPLRVDAP